MSTVEADVKILEHLVLADRDEFTDAWTAHVGDVTVPRLLPVRRIR